MEGTGIAVFFGKIGKHGGHNTRVNVCCGSVIEVDLGHGNRVANVNQIINLTD